MAAIPSSGSLVATHDYYRRRLGSTSSNSSCGSAEYPGEAIPHHPGLPKADPGHWWASFFFGKSTLPFMATVLESPEHKTPKRKMREPSSLPPQPHKSLPDTQ
nr:pancreatic progenitor cell differentiation and proliferation factor isoform X2 [Equus asinus]